MRVQLSTPIGHPAARCGISGRPAATRVNAASRASRRAGWRPTIARLPTATVSVAAARTASSEAAARAARHAGGVGEPRVEVVPHGAESLAQRLRGPRLARLLDERGAPSGHPEREAAVDPRAGVPGREELGARGRRHHRVVAHRPAVDVEADGPAPVRGGEVEGVHGDAGRRPARGRGRTRPGPRSSSASAVAASRAETSSRSTMPQPVTSGADAVEPPPAVDPRRPQLRRLRDRAGEGHAAAGRAPDGAGEVALAQGGVRGAGQPAHHAVVLHPREGRGEAGAGEGLDDAEEVLERHVRPAELGRGREPVEPGVGQRAEVALRDRRRRVDLVGRREQHVGGHVPGPVQHVTHDTRG